MPLTRQFNSSYSVFHMEETTPQAQQPKQKDNAIIFYILGGLIVTAIIVAGFVLIPKSKEPTPAAQGTTPVLGETAVAPTAAPMVKGPIGSLSCTNQFYNTVNGVAETYYLTTEGEVPTAGGGVTCTLTASVNNQVVATEQVVPVLNPAADRGGSTFRCTTKGLALRPGVPTKVTTDLVDANGVTASCNRTFLLP